MAAASIDQLVAAHQFLCGCVQAGLRRVIISPGSRSTPLAIAATEVGNLAWSVHLDERSAAFAALGEAKASGEPVGLVCTSGTAAANYLPAIAEAGQSDVPLVILTADRPPEHISWGVGQSFVQPGLYGSQVRSQILMPVGGDGGIDHALRAGARATITAVRRKGPVHVNWPFRLPLEPSGGPFPSTPSVVVTSDTDHAATLANPASVRAFDDIVSSRTRGIIVAGPAASIMGPAGEQLRAAVIDFATRAGYPIVADVLSGFRGSPDSPLIDQGPHVLEHGSVDADLIIRLGDSPTAKSVRTWSETRADAAHVLLDPHERWHDPGHLATHVFGDAVGPLLSASTVDRRSAHGTWASEIVEAGSAARGVVDALLDETAPWTEAHVARTIGASANGAAVVASSSMPIRDLDTFVSSRQPLDAWSNRGINGVDGVVATAIGVARARPSERVIVHIGDVALLHDIGSVLDAVRQRIPLTIVVPNNNGGGIFSFLPIRDVMPESSFQALFHTPHDTNFDALGGFEGVHHEVVTPATLAGRLADTASADEVTILEARVSILDHVRLHANVHSQVSSLLTGG